MYAYHTRRPQHRNASDQDDMLRAGYTLAPLQSKQALRASLRSYLNRLIVIAANQANGLARELYIRALARCYLLLIHSSTFIF